VRLHDNEHDKVCLDDYVDGSVDNNKEIVDVINDIMIERYW